MTQASSKALVHARSFLYPTFISSHYQPTRSFSTTLPTLSSHPESSKPPTPARDVVSMFLCLGTPPPPFANVHSQATAFRVALFQRRFDRPVYGGKWGVVTGKFENVSKEDGSLQTRKETADEAAARELYEETGLYLLFDHKEHDVVAATTQTGSASATSRSHARTLVHGEPYDIHDRSIEARWRIWPRLVEVLVPGASRGRLEISKGVEGNEAVSGSESRGLEKEGGDLLEVQDAIDAANGMMKVDETELMRVEWISLDQMTRFNTVDGLQATLRLLMAQYHGDFHTMDEQRRALQTGSVR